MPRFVGGSIHLASKRALARRIVRVWHIGCISLCAGCFYVKPAWTPPENDPPMLIEPPNDGQQNVTVTKDLSLDTNLFVVASDPNDDPVFIFFLDEAEEWLDVLPTGTEASGGSTLYFRSARVNRVDPELDGRIVRALITDEPGETVNVFFELSVPQ